MSLYISNGMFLTGFILDIPLISLGHNKHLSYFPTYTTVISTSTRPSAILRSCLVVQHRGKIFRYVLRERLSYDRHTTVIGRITTMYVIYTMAI